MRNPELLRPLHGVRAVEGAKVFVDPFTDAVAAIMRPDQFFSHATAASLWGMPLPLAQTQARLVHVSAIHPSTAPARAGVKGHRVVELPGGLAVEKGMLLSSPTATWCLLAAELDVVDLIAIGDHIVTGDVALASLPELAEAASRWKGRPGALKLMRALPHIRVGPKSRPETFLRLLVVAAGLPEPKCNENIYDDEGLFLAEGDLVWREFRRISEYEGEHHHRDRRQFRKDIARRERVEDAGWRLTRFTSDDLFLRPRETVERVARRLGMSIRPTGLRRAMALAARFRP